VRKFSVRNIQWLLPGSDLRQMLLSVVSVLSSWLASLAICVNKTFNTNQTFLCHHFIR